jgi:hypothetical protein
LQQPLSVGLFDTSLVSPSLGHTLRGTSGIEVEGEVFMVGRRVKVGSRGVLMMNRSEDQFEIIAKGRKGNTYETVGSTIILLSARRELCRTRTKFIVNNPAHNSSDRRVKSVSGTHQSMRSAIIIYLFGVLGQGLLSLARLLKPSLNGTLVTSQLAS